MHLEVSAHTQLVVQRLLYFASVAVGACCVFSRVAQGARTDVDVVLAPDATQVKPSAPFLTVFGVVPPYGPGGGALALDILLASDFAEPLIRPYPVPL